MSKDFSKSAYWKFPPVRDTGAHCLRNSRVILRFDRIHWFRWVKISNAMGGTRSARQVASRVQKFTEKMKKFGLDMT